jgi:hypothetical protein
MNRIRLAPGTPSTARAAGPSLWTSVLPRAAFVAALAWIAGSALAADDTATSAPPASSGDAYGPFGWLDHRSAYGSGDFPEPFLVDDSDLEVNEARLDWLHTSVPGARTDLVTGEVEKGFGLLTLEVEVPHERDTATVVDPGTGRSSTVVTQGLSNVDLGARVPVFQKVSADGFVDTSYGVAIEVGVPTNSPVSRNAEIVPKVFTDLKLGGQFTMQAIFGLSMLRGGGGDGGLNTFEYGFTFGYSINHRDLPLPGVLRLIPILELDGETEMNKDEPGHNSLVANLGFRLNLKSVGRVEPRLGLGYVFPVDNGGRQDLRSGIVTSLVFEY